MPELISSQYEVQLSDAERKRYEELKKELVLQLPDGDVTAANAATLTMKLSQMANGAIYSDDGTVLPIHDRKLDALEDIIESANGKPVLVAYWFRHDLLRIRQRFTVREIKTSQDIADWNAGAIPVAVIHPASAGHGLNLQQGGSTLVWFGLNMESGTISTNECQALAAGADIRNCGYPAYNHERDHRRTHPEGPKRKKQDPGCTD
jgi:SNF2 family DNA or RNA helicase